MTYLLPFIFAAINRFRGMDAIIPAQKLVCYGLFGLTAAAGSYLEGVALWWAIGLVVVAGSALWRQQGRNQYLATAHGRIYEGQKANFFGNWLANTIAGIPTITNQQTPVGSTSFLNRKWCAVGMAALGLFAAPYIAAVAWLAGNPWMMLLAPLTALEGLIYFGCYYLPLKENYKNAPAEALTGLLHGVLIWQVV